MSDNVGAVGFMVPLCKKLSKEQLEDLQEELWERESNVHFNYEGTLAYTEERTSGYGITFGGTKYTQEIGDSFEVLAEFGIEISAEQARSYSCYYYNGVDSDMDMMTLEQFLEDTGQNE